jgi:thiopeptide-type bacteriocin biosynthesis protein
MAVAEAHFMASSELALACIERTVDAPARRRMVALQAFRALLHAAGIAGDARRSLLAAYADYWRHVHLQLTGTQVPPFVAGAEARTWLGASVATTAALRRLIGAMAGSGLKPWMRSLDRDIGTLTALAATDRLTQALPTIVANFAHTLHNRLDLGVADEVMVAEYLLQAEAPDP